MLQAELEAHGTDEGRRWTSALRPLAQVFATRSQSWLALATYLIRVRTNRNSAFALVLARRYALAADDRKLAEAFNNAIIRSSVNLARFISRAFVRPRYNPRRSKCALRNRLTWLTSTGSPKRRSIVVRSNLARRFRGEAAEGPGRGEHEAEEASGLADDGRGCPSRAAFKEVVRPGIPEAYTAHLTGSAKQPRIAPPIVRCSNATWRTNPEALTAAG
ncbi:DUF2891 family protein [Bradyrhizobium sp. 137]|nr:DUF2891 family protein [Bradyrhizobium sp. 137]